jgi:hypothetical protein
MRRSGTPFLLLIFLLLSLNRYQLEEFPFSNEDDDGDVDGVEGDAR